MTPYDQRKQVELISTYSVLLTICRYLFATAKDTLLPPQLSARRYSPLYLELRTRGGVTPKSIDGDWADGAWASSGTVDNGVSDQEVERDGSEGRHQTLIRVGAGGANF